jgi:hypothetical protein
MISLSVGLYPKESRYQAVNLGTKGALCVPSSPRSSQGIYVTSTNMTSLSSAHGNQILLLGVGLTTCAVLVLMRQMLIVYRHTLEVQKPNSGTQYITQSTEDSLKTSTLEKLIRSHNYGIQETATRIVCDRALHDGATLKAVLRELTRPDRDRREQAIRALFMLREQRLWALVCVFSSSI